MRAWVRRRRAARSGAWVFRPAGGLRGVHGALPLAEGSEAPCKAPGGPGRGLAWVEAVHLGRAAPVPCLFSHARQGGGGPTRRRGGRRPGGPGGVTPCQGAASRRRAGRPAERPRSGPGSWGPWLPPSGGLLMGAGWGPRVAGRPGRSPGRVSSRRAAGLARALFFIKPFVIPL